MKPRCDCLNFCGDDPYLDKGLVRPCPTFEAEIASRRLHDAAPDLLAALKGLLMASDSPDDYPDEYEAARAAIRKAEGK